MNIIRFLEKMNEKSRFQRIQAGQRTECKASETFGAAAAIRPHMVPISIYVERVCVYWRSLPARRTTASTAKKIRMWEQQFSFGTVKTVARLTLSYQRKIAVSLLLREKLPKQQNTKRAKIHRRIKNRRTWPASNHGFSYETLRKTTFPASNGGFS